MPADIEVIRFRAPDPKDHADLARSGFVLKPSRVSWLAARWTPKNCSWVDCPRSNGRRSRRPSGLDKSGIDIHEPERLTESSLDAFLRQYEQQVAAMPYGVGFAVRERDTMLDNLDDYLIVNAYAGRELVAGCVTLVRRDRNTMHIRISATHPRARQHSLTRPLYLRAVEAARELKLGAVSLGNDTTLYGHIVKPGLFSFKARLALCRSRRICSRSPHRPTKRTWFVPRPATQSVPAARLHQPGPDGPARSTALAARPKGMRYKRTAQRRAGHPPLSMVVLAKGGSAETEVEATRYRADFLGSVEVRRLPG